MKAYDKRGTNWRSNSGLHEIYRGRPAIRGHVQQPYFPHQTFMDRDFMTEQSLIDCAINIIKAEQNRLDDLIVDKKQELQTIEFEIARLEAYFDNTRH